MAQTGWSISELSKEFGITPRTLRFYEDNGLVTPQRQGQKRLYSQRDRTRLKLTLRGKRLGLALSEICELVNMYEGPGSSQQQLQLYLKVLKTRKQQLLRQQRDIKTLLKDIKQQEDNCLQLLQKPTNE